MKTIHERGFAASGIRDITTAAGVPQGSFTNHFASKEAFGVAVLDRYYLKTEAIIAGTLLDEKRAPLERLSSYFDAITELLAVAGWRHGCLIGNMSLEAAEHSELLRERLVEILSGLTQPFAAVVRAAQLSGDVRMDIAANDLAVVLLSAWQGAMLRMKVDRSPEPLALFKRVFITALIAVPKPTT